MAERQLHPLSVRGWPASRGTREAGTNDAKNAADWQFTEPFPFMSMLSRHLWVEMLAHAFKAYSYTYNVSIFADIATLRSWPEVK